MSAAACPCCNHVSTTHPVAAAITGVAIGVILLLAFRLGGPVTGAVVIVAVSLLGWAYQTETVILWQHRRRRRHAATRRPGGDA